MSGAQGRRADLRVCRQPFEPIRSCPLYAALMHRVTDHYNSLLIHLIALGTMHGQAQLLNHLR